MCIRDRYYIKNGLKKHWHWLAYLFSALGVLTVFGTGNATQVNTITAAPVSYTHLDVYKRQIIYIYIYYLDKTLIKLCNLFYACFSWITWTAFIIIC